MLSKNRDRCQSQPYHYQKRTKSCEGHILQKSPFIGCRRTTVRVWFLDHLFIVIFGGLFGQNGTILNLMTEVTDTGKYHSQPQPVRSIDDSLIPNRTSRLDHGCGASTGNFFHTIGKRKEGV